MSRHKTKKAQPGPAQVNNLAPAKVSTGGKAEGVETISGGGNRWVSPVITTQKIRDIEDSALLQEPIQNLVNLIFRGPAQVTVYDPAGDTDDVLSEQAWRRYQDLDLYTAHQQAFYDGLLGGCGVFSPGYDEMEKKDVFRHMPWYSFSKRHTSFSDTYNEIMPGITVDKSTRQVRVFQVQDDTMLEPIEIQNFAIIRDPTGPAPAGKPMCLPVVPIVWNYNYAIKVIQQKLNRVGAPPVFPLANVTAKNKELWESFAKTWGKDTVFVLPPDTEFADLKIVDNRVAEEYAAWLKKQATDYWNPATFVQKDGNSIGGSDSGAMELVYNYIDRTLSWIENGITKATQNFLLNGDWTDDGGYLQRGYRVEIKHTRPSVSKDAAILAEVAELAKNNAITKDEMRQSLPNTDLGEITPEKAAELEAQAAAKQPVNPFGASPFNSTPPGDYQMVGNVQTPAQRTEVMSDTERALIEATRKCAADVKRIALKDYPHKEE